MEISKPDIAQRLLNEAIRGRLRGDDALTVHLGAMSAFMVSRDLCRRRGLGGSSIEAYLPEQARRAFWTRFAELNNAIKHADRDPEATVDIAGIDGLTEMVILLAIDNLQRLGHAGAPGIWAAYATTCFLLQHPEGIAENAPAAYREAFAAGVFAHIDHDMFRAMARDPEMERQVLAEAAAHLEAAGRRAPA